MHVFNMITAPNFFPGDTIPYGAIEVGHRINILRCYRHRCRERLRKKISLNQLAANADCVDLPAVEVQIV